MKQKNQRNSKKRLNSLVLLVAFTAIMLIVSTYAWFSANNEVKLTTLQGTVNVVEGLQISLDAKSWSNEINLKSANLKSAYDGNVNIIPTSELLPVSTTGAAVVDDQLTDLTMYRGENDGKVKLEKITAAPTTNDGNNEPGYYAFDLFVMNSSKTNTADKLQLNKNSLLQLGTLSESGEFTADTSATGKLTSGLQNTVRVAIAKYADTAELTDSDTSILSKTKGDGKYISDVAIWEPNANAHIDGIVSSNNRLTLSSTDKTTWGLSDNTFTKTQAIPTYGLTAAAAVTATTITDIYKWDTIATAGEPAKPVLGIQNTLQTNAIASEAVDKSLGAVYNLKSTSASTKDTAQAPNTSVDFTIEANKVTRLRVFLWIEGQDVDCTNYASHGGTIQLDLGLCKGAETIANARPAAGS